MNTEDSKLEENFIEEEKVYDEDLVFEDEEDVIEEGSLNDKNKKLRDELKLAKEQSQEYLIGWQKERASFANYKTEEEKKRKERLDMMKLNLLSDFFPVLDSFDMAFSNKEAWEKVEPAWRSGVEYIYGQFKGILDTYNLSIIDTVGVEFNPKLHDPIEHVSVENESDDHKVLKVIQKGYQSGDMVLRPAKVNVGKYENSGN